MRVLFAEPKSYYSSIIDCCYFLENEVEFDGINRFDDVEYIKSFDLVIYIQYLWPLCSGLILNARDNKVRTLLLTDGIVEWNNCFNHPVVKREGNILFSRQICDYILTPSKFTTRVINGNDLNVAFTPNKMKNKDLENSRTFKYDVLLTTANVAYFDEDEYKELIYIIEEIIKVCVNKNYKIGMRIFDNRILDALSDFEFENHLSCDFDEFIKMSNVLITTPSSVIVTAMEANKRTCQIIYRDTPLLVQSGWMIHSSLNIEKTIVNLVKVNNSEVISRMRFQDNIIIDFDNYDIQESIHTIYESKLFEQKDINPEAKELLRILNSPYNFNFEFLLRKLNLKIKEIFLNVKRIWKK